MRTAISLIMLAALAAGAAFGQQVVSAKSGMIHYALGEVMLDGKLVEIKLGVYPQMKETSVLSTTEGLAEVLLGPSAVLRIGENSAFKLVSDRLLDTRIELQRGSAVVEVMELVENDLTVMVGNATISIEKPGVYRLDAEPARLMVYDGQAAVDLAGQTQIVKKSRMLALAGVAIPEKFDNKAGDSLFRWAKGRSEAMAMANVSAAKYARDRGTVLTRSSWAYNPYFGMFTYLPCRGVYNSFWGYRYWSPRQVYVVYDRPRSPGWSGGGADMGPSSSGWHRSSGGYNSVSQASSGSSGVVTSSATAGASNSSAPAPAASHPGASGGGGRAR